MHVNVFEHKGTWLSVENRVWLSNVLMPMIGKKKILLTLVSVVTQYHLHWSRRSVPSCCHKIPSHRDDGFESNKKRVTYYVLYIGLAESVDFQFPGGQFVATRSSPYLLWPAYLLYSTSV